MGEKVDKHPIIQKILGSEAALRIKIHKESDGTLRGEIRKLAAKQVAAFGKGKADLLG